MNLLNMCPATRDVAGGVAGLFRQAQVTQLRHDATSGEGNVGEPML
jgi:hypothetical protein